VSLADWTSVIGLGFAALAAYFAGRAVHYARQTVHDGETASEAAATRHLEQIAAMNAATKAAAEQHRVEMEDRRQVVAAERVERQLRELDALMEMVLDIRDAVGKVNQERSVAQEGWLPPVLIRLESAQKVCAALGVNSPATAELASFGRNAGTRIGWLSRQSVDALLELQRLQIEVVAGQAPTADAEP
jgi:hypothetical protein